jgi:hypothetical protein
MRFFLSIAIATMCAAGCASTTSAQATYDASRHIIDMAQAGKAAADRCKEGGDGALLCPKVAEAFDDISDVAKQLRETAAKEGAK